MLPRLEATQRHVFYTAVFGEKCTRKNYLFPTALWPVVNYKIKILGLTKRGFKKPEKMIKLFPAILGLSFKNIDAKILNFAERGFESPEKMIATSPSILGYSFENIDTKILGLTERGFKSPQKMIAKLPTILGFSFKNIDRKLKKARRLKVNINAFISYTVVFIGISTKHYIPILRKCRMLNLEPTPKNIFGVYISKSYQTN